MKNTARIQSNPSAKSHNHQSQNTRFNADQILISHALATLPASLPHCKELLTAVHCKITESHPAWRNISTQIQLLETLAELQQELL